MTVSAAAAPQTLEARAPATTQLFPSARQRTLLLCLLLTAVVLVSYSPVTGNGFLNYDDDGYITGNPQVQAGLTWTTVKWAFTTYDKANWHPLTWLSHALDCELFGLKPAGHHYTNVLLHAANAVLLFLLLQTATGYRWRSLMVAALFALHPINVESVAWASERKNVLSMLFFLLALHAYVWYARKSGLNKSSLGRYSAVACLFALGLLSKPQVITLPLLLLLLDYWPLNRIGSPGVTHQDVGSQDVASLDVANQDAQPERAPSVPLRWLILEKLPLLLLSAASVFMTMKAQRAGGAVKTLAQYSVLLRVETCVISYVRYLGKAFWPSHLVALYPHPTELYPAWQVAAAALALILITALVLVPTARDRRYLAVGWFWFLGSLVPMIGLVQVGTQAIADRYAYIPFIGLFLMVTWLVADWAEAHRFPIRWLAVPSVACLLSLGTLTYRQVGYWHDTESFWLRTLSLTRNNFVAEDILGDFLTSQGRREDAAMHYRAAVVIHPDDIPANLNLADYERDRDNLSAAIGHYQLVLLRAARLNNAAAVNVRTVASINLGSAYTALGEPAKAKQSFEAALQLAPDAPEALVGLGLLAQKAGDLPEAVRQYSHAMAVQPTDVGYLLLARALQQQGHTDQANAIVERITRLSPDFPKAQKTADSLLAGR
jgi:tetratricopeptide (TPR) repeat protein